MRTLHHRLAGEPVYIHYYTGPEDDERFYEWLAQSRDVLGVDTETTGLDIYSRDFKARLVQIGDRTTSWVIPARFLEPIQHAIRTAPLIAMHNAPHDLHTMDRHLGLSLEEVHPKVIDTMILAHINEPRGGEDGFPGHGLKAQSVAFVDHRADELQQKLKDTFKARGWKIDDGWTLIEEDDETYVKYSGLDPIETVRIFEYLWPRVRGNKKLINFEHRLQRLLARMERKGLALDVGYSTKLQEELDAIVTENDHQIVEMFKNLGVAKLTPRAQRGCLDAITIALGGHVFKTLKSGKLTHRHRQTDAKLYPQMSSGSNQVVVAALQAMGEKLTLVTDSGALSVEKDVLNELCDVNKDDERLELREPNPLARLVKDAKRAGKWRSSYVDSMLDNRCDLDRVHAKISSLGARTGRMSISRPPFQQLPSSGRMIRDCIIADPGHLLISADYDQVEMRLLAAMADEPQMKQAIAEGVDLHDMTATILFGTGFTPKQRKSAKNTGFGKVYGGGAKTLAKQTGISLGQAKDVIVAYDEAFPGVKEYGLMLQAAAMEDDLYVQTPITGRRLPLDPDRVYAVTNYMIQSTARDIFAQALLNLDKAGLGDYLLLPVHDEIIAQAPAHEAEEVAWAIGHTMTTTFNGVILSAKGEVIGTKWGEAYK